VTDRGAGSDLDLTPSEHDRRTVYHLMTSVVVPRPIAWVSTVSSDGVANLAPHSYFNVVSSAPPHVVVGSAGVKDTVTNIRATGEFVVNIATADLIDAVNTTSVDAPPDVDEFVVAGLTAAPSAVVAAPRVAESPVHLECLLRHDLELGGGVLIVGEVVHVHVDARVLRDGVVDVDLLRPLARLGGLDFAEVGATTARPRPRWTDPGRSSR